MTDKLKACLICKGAKFLSTDEDGLPLICGRCKGTGTECDQMDVLVPYRVVARKDELLREAIDNIRNAGWYDKVTKDLITRIEKEVCE